MDQGLRQTVRNIQIYYEQKIGDSQQRIGELEKNLTKRDEEMTALQKDILNLAKEVLDLRVLIKKHQHLNICTECNEVFPADSSIKGCMGRSHDARLCPECLPNFSLTCCKCHQYICEICNCDYRKMCKDCRNDESDSESNSEDES